MRLLTYNIRGGLGIDGRRDISRIASVIRESAADIVCLQEVHQRLPVLPGGFLDQPAILRRLAGMTCHFQRTMGIPGFGYGIAIATRLPVMSVKRLKLPARGEPRSLLEIRLDALTVLCTHLGLSAEERLAQVEAIAERVNEIDGPVVLAGDFNETPGGAAVTTLLRQTTLHDAAPTGPATYPADNPRARIDLILHNTAVVVNGVHTLNTTASDHLPVIGACDIVATS